MTPTTARWSDWGPLLILLLPLGAVDIAICPLMRKISPHDYLSFVVYAAFGTIIAQASLLTTGLVFNRGPFWQRLLMHWLIAADLVLCWALGFLLANSFYFDRDMIDRDLRRNAAAVFCSLPAFSLGLQIPLWGGKLWLGWRNREAEGGQASTRLSISDLFTTTAVVAATLAIARLAPLMSANQNRPDQQWMQIGIFAACGLGLGFFAVALLVGIFRIRWPLGARWGIALGTALTLATGSLAVPASGLVGIGLEPIAIIGFYSQVTAYTATVCLGLTLQEVCPVQLARGLRAELK